MTPDGADAEARACMQAREREQARAEVQKALAARYRSGADAGTHVTGRFTQCCPWLHISSGPLRSCSCADTKHRDYYLQSFLLCASLVSGAARHTLARAMVRGSFL